MWRRNDRPFALNEVLVKLDGFALVLPTFNFCFWKSLCFSFFFLVLEPILCSLAVCGRVCGLNMIGLW